jgi:hypothetical protein
MFITTSKLKRNLFLCCMKNGNKLYKSKDNKRSLKLEHSPFNHSFISAMTAFCIFYISHNKIPVCSLTVSVAKQFDLCSETAHQSDTHKYHKVLQVTST